MPRLISGAIGQGANLVSEYRRHRQEQKEARETSQAEAARVQSSSNPPHTLPPSYEDTASDRLVASARVPTPSDDKEPARYEGDTDSSYDSTSSLDIDSDDEAWALDDAVSHSDDEEPPSYETATVEATRQTTHELVQDVMINSTLPDTTERSTPLVRRSLPCPVILPQRRPHKRARGFVRAYAPVLADTGIDQDTFLKFLKNLHKSSQASPIFKVIGISAGIAGLTPSIIAMVVCTSVEVAARAGAEVQRRYRTNDFLDQMNASLFKPAGLYAMIVRYKKAKTTGDSSVHAESVNLSTYRAIAKHSKQRSYDAEGASSQSMSDRFNNLHLASATTRGELEMPEAAPLIYPELDCKIAKEGPESFKDKTKDANKFISNYMDRRAQMSFAKQSDAPSSLIMPQSEQQTPSGAADPSHPMYSGGLLALATGGALTPRLRQQTRRASKQSARDMRRIQRGKAPRHGYMTESADSQSQDGSTMHPVPGAAGPSSGSMYVHVGRKSRRRDAEGKRKKGPIKRVLQEDVLYLMVVNMPSEAELATAREELAKEKQH